jgi:hypothetical protein
MSKEILAGNNIITPTRSCTGRKMMIFLPWRQRCPHHNIDIRNHLESSACLACRPILPRGPADMSASFRLWSIILIPGSMKFTSCPFIDIPLRYVPGTEGVWLRKNVPLGKRRVAYRGRVSSFWATHPLFEQDKRARLVSFEHRWHMCQIAFGHLSPRVVVSDAEYQSWKWAVRGL